MTPPAQLARWLQGIPSPTPETTAQLAKTLAPHLPENTTLALHGPIGAGKTTFVRGLARAYGITRPIPSPTHALFALYETPARQLVHMDAYRLNTPAEADALMLWDILREPWTLAIEWPENLGDRLPRDAWHLVFEKHTLRLILP
ncbi:MAG: tRNA (adenosine(37)-N6)-threonylcarbamoyltransferase complex ATPase subunit type 1 TsaE [Puniceicoccales bacterium]|jgi:tRNA threonylcarbamoyladenosine biosynthesis protein TsaE|nr:tRNA (adenosine(37)-N6)-threonylcarbamoyltransferase complex ATPase subunit type 1 TsaE [Puniceicoccales bacterium]